MKGQEGVTILYYLRCMLWGPLLMHDSLGISEHFRTDQKCDGPTNVPLAWCYGRSGWDSPNASSCQKKLHAC